MLSRRAPGVVKLRRGDFLEDQNVHRILEKTDVLFVNIYAFESDVNWRLMQLFLGMKVIHITFCRHT